MESQAALAMIPTLASNPGWSFRRGYSLLEIMIVLAIMSVAVSIMVPRAGAALDQVVVHTIQFDLQRQISDQRRRAFSTQSELGLEIQPTSEESVHSDSEAEDLTARVTVPKGWTAELESPVTLYANGQCTPTRLHLSSLGKNPIHMALRDTCQLIRYFGP